jgi:simple sugar transport system ATP-binding protein
MASDLFLDLRHVAKRFGGVTALSDVDWDVRRGEVHCLVGENGCGKSTLIKIVTGVHPADPGSEIVIDGERRDRLDPATAKRLGIQVIFQDLSLFPNLTVAENIAFDDNLRGLGRLARSRGMRRIATGQIARLGVTLDPDARVSSLPIASRQLVAIARGLAGSAKLIFMDEPTASLTRAEVNVLLGIVGKLKADGLSVVFVSHKLDEVIAIADRVTVLRDGRKVGTYAAREVDARRIGALMTGVAFDHKVSARDVSAAPALLSVRDLTRRGEYDNISFELRRGEVLGITGLLGAGRTELALSLFGMAKPDSGSILLDGKPLRLAGNREAIEAGIAYVSEDRLNLGLNLKQPIEMNLNLAVFKRLGGALGWISGSARRANAQAWIDRLKIKIGGLDLPVNTLSGGNQQRVVLGKWLSTRPRILILDSPTVGVDIGNKEAIYAIVRELAGEGVSVLVISDEVPELYGLCDRILHMRAGRFSGEFIPGKIEEKAIEQVVYA